MTKTSVLTGGSRLYQNEPGPRFPRLATLRRSGRSCRAQDPRDGRLCSSERVLIFALCDLERREKASGPQSSRTTGGSRRSAGRGPEHVRLAFLPALSLYLNRGAFFSPSSSASSSCTRTNNHFACEFTLAGAFIKGSWTPDSAASIYGPLWQILMSAGPPPTRLSHGEELSLVLHWRSSSSSRYIERISRCSTAAVVFVVVVVVSISH